MSNPFLILELIMATVEDSDKDTPLWRYLTERLKRFNPNDPSSEQFYLIPKGSSTGFYRQECLYSDALEAEAKKDSPNSKVSDIEMFKAHLKLKKDQPEVGDLNVSSILPRGQSFNVSYEIDQESSDTWQTPVSFIGTSNRHDLREIVIPSFDKEVFTAGVKAYNNVTSFERQSMDCTAPRAFSVESVFIPRSEYRNICKKRKSGKTYHFTFDPNNIEDPIKVPIRLIIGGSRGFSMLFTFGLSEVRDSSKLDKNSGNFMFMYSDIPKEVIDLWRDLPSLYSVDAHSEISAIHGILTDLYDINIDSEDYVEFKVFELSALAIANGCVMDSYSIYSLSAVTTGRPFPSGIDLMDQNWGKSYDELGPYPKKYFKVKMMLLHDIFIIHTGLLLRNIFPDPCITLSTTEVSQQSFICWFSELVGESLSCCHIPDEFEPFSTRAELLLSLARPLRQPLTEFVDLIMNVPISNCGGARYLHHAGFNFMKQYMVMSNIRLPSYSGEVPNCNKDLEKERLSLMFRREFAGDSGEPTRKVGLVASPSCAKSLVTLNMDDLTSLPTDSADIHGLKEWGRLNVDEIPAVFSKLRRLSSDELARSWLDKIDLYLYLVNVYYHARNIRIAVPALEQSLMIRKLNVGVRYQNDLTKAAKVYMKRKQRVDVFNRTSSTQRLGVHQAVHEVVPGDFTRENRLKAQARKRRIARSKVTKHRNGLKWTAEKEVIIDRRAAELKANGYTPDATEPKPSTSNATLLRPDDMRHILRKKATDFRFNTGADVIAFNQSLKASKKKPKRKY